MKLGFTILAAFPTEWCAEDNAVCCLACCHDAICQDFSALVTQMLLLLLLLLRLLLQSTPLLWLLLAVLLWLLLSQLSLLCRGFTRLQICVPLRSLAVMLCAAAQVLMVESAWLACYGLRVSACLIDKTS